MSANDTVETVEDALIAVLFAATARRKLRIGDNLGLSTGLANDLRDRDRCDIDALAMEIGNRLPERANRGVGTLRHHFPKTFAAYESATGTDSADMFSAFMASPQIRPWKPIPFAGLGPPLEACFATWALLQPWSDAAVVEHELLSTLCRALATDPEPAFIPPAAFRGAPGHWVAVSEAAPPTVYAAVHGRVVTGPVTPLIAGVLRGEPDSALADRLRVPLQNVVRTREAVVQKGLLLQS